MRISAFTDLIFPKIIWGERIGLRSVNSRLTPAEIERVYQWSCNEDILRWSGGRATELTFAEFQKQIDRERWKPHSYEIVRFIVSRTGDLVGKMGLYSIDWQKCDGELGLVIDKKYWSQNYGTETVQVFLRYIFLKTPIQRAYLGTYKDNIRAVKLAEKSGFRVTGMTKRYSPILKEEIEGIEMEMLRSEYRNEIMR